MLVDFTNVLALSTFVITRKGETAKTLMKEEKKRKMKTEVVICAKG